MPIDRFYVDFSTKLVAAERLLWERALKVSYSSSSSATNGSVDGGGDRYSGGSSTNEWAGGRSLEEAEAAFVMVVAPVIEKLVRTAGTTPRKLPCLRMHMPKFGRRMLPFIFRFLFAWENIFHAERACLVFSLFAVYPENQPTCNQRP